MPPPAPLTRENNKVQYNFSFLTCFHEHIYFSGGLYGRVLVECAAYVWRVLQNAEYTGKTYTSRDRRCVSGVIVNAPRDSRLKSIFSPIIGSEE